ncbi:ig-like domain-containing protein [Trichonephila clavata]|uniref:Ig-like domain-containing protein n=1 Tax=Trichonephila clavata TaxID=2740835 RepID=A0A8X6JBG7_TRICU|nr:ig-like domain-containing protein [Trichonephila clavata]
MGSQTDGIPPTFAKKPSIRQEDEGRRLLFECRILADPKPTVYWYHDNDPVKESSRCKMKCPSQLLTGKPEAWQETLRVEILPIF